MKPIEVFLIDDHDVVRTGVRKMLELEDDMVVIGEASNYHEALETLETISPSVILMDIKMPGMDGIELTRQLKSKDPDCIIVIFTLHADYLHQAMTAGASGYILKDIRRAELADLIRQALNGETVISKNINQEF